MGLTYLLTLLILLYREGPDILTSNPHSFLVVISLISKYWVIHGKQNRFQRCICEVPSTVNVLRMLLVDHAKLNTHAHKNPAVNLLVSLEIRKVQDRWRKGSFHIFVYTHPPFKQRCMLFGQTCACIMGTFLQQIWRWSPEHYPKDEFREAVTMENCPRSAPLGKR